MPRHASMLAVLGFASACGAAGIVLTLKARNDNADAAAAPVLEEQVAAVPFGEQPPPEDPPKTRPVSTTTRTSRTGIPRDGGLWPWPISKAPTEAPVMVTHLTGVVRNKDGKKRVTVKSAAVNTTSGKAVVTMSGFDPKKRPTKPSWGEIVVCDLTTGRVTHQWETAKPLAPFDIHRDGSRFLLRLAQGGYDTDSQVVELWEVGKDNAVRRRTWRPYAVSFNNSNYIAAVNENPPNTHIEEAQIKWAGFVGSDHIATLHGTALRIWEADSLRGVSAIPGVVGLPAVSPDGDKLAFLTGDAVGLFDPASMSVISAKRLGPLPENPVLTFHPSGLRLAAVGTGRAIVLDLQGGHVWEAMLAELKNDKPHNWIEMPPACGWAGDRHIFFKGELYDLDMPVPVWHYHWADWANIQGRSAWAVADHPRDAQVVLRPFTIPHPGMQAKLHAMMLTSDIFDLRPRDRVAVDVSGMPAASQENIRKTLESRLAKLGFAVEPTAPVVFKASIDAPKPAKVNYNGKDYTYTSQPARLRAFRGDREIWSTTGCNSPPFMIWYNTSDGLADAVRRYGGADYTIFTSKPLPGVVRKSGKTSGALGSSSFHAHGIEDK